MGNSSDTLEHLCLGTDYGLLLFCRLREKFLVHAQDDKAAALVSLTDRFLDSQLDGFYSKVWYGLNLMAASKVVLLSTVGCSLFGVVIVIVSN